MKTSFLAKLGLWGAAAVLSIAAHAQSKVVFLSTADDVNPPVGGAGDTLVQEARSAFQAAVPTGSIWVDRTNKLSQSGAANSVAADLADANLLVLETVYAPAAADRMAEVEAAILSNPKLVVLAFVDGCCSVANNLAPFVNIINQIKPWPATVGLAAGTNPVTAPLSASSLYRQTFVGLPNMQGGAYEGLTNVPVDYSLYLDPVNAGLTPPGAYGIFVPQAASNGGAGACVFLTADASPFGFPAQVPALANAFVSAALDPNGACKLPAAGAPDWRADITGPATLTPGTPDGYNLTVSNQGVGLGVATTVVVTMPAGVTVVPGSLPAACTPAAGNASFTCNVAQLAAANPTALPPVAGGSIAFPFQAVASAGSPGGNMQAVVTTQPAEINAANNTATLAVAVGAVPAVPAVGTWGLLLLSAMLAGVAARRRAA